MTTDEELKALKAQKKELERRIKELENNCWVVQHGCATIRFERYPTQIPDRWYLAIKSDTSKYSTEQRSAFRSIVSARTKEDVIDSIPGIINDLQELYKKAKQ